MSPIVPRRVMHLYVIVPDLIADFGCGARTSVFQEECTNLTIAHMAAISVHKIDACVLCLHAFYLQHSAGLR